MRTNKILREKSEKLLIRCCLLTRALGKFKRVLSNVRYKKAYRVLKVRFVTFIRKWKTKRMQRYLEMIYKTIGTDNKLIISESLINNIINVQKSFRTLLVRRRMGYLIMDMNWSKLELKNMSKLKKSYGITNSYMSRMKKQKTDILEFQVPQKVRRLYMYESMRAKRIKYIYDMKVYKKDMIKYEEKMRDQAKQIKILKTLGADNIQLPEIKVPEKPILRSF